jgi:hypothetical protein
MSLQDRRWIAFQETKEMKRESTTPITCSKDACIQIVLTLLDETSSTEKEAEDLQKKAKEDFHVGLSQSGCHSVAMSQRGV